MIRVDTILEDVQVVGGCYGDDVLRWVPSHVQDFLGEVQAINAHVSTATLTTSVHSPGPQHSPRLAAFPPCLQGYASPRLPVKHPEEAVVCPCHDDAERGEEMDIMRYADGEERKSEVQGSEENKNRRQRIDWTSAKLVCRIDLNVG